MIARISRAKSGLSNYLEKGHRKDSEYTREQKDNVVPIYGSLEIFRQTEQYLNKEKNYKDNYLHITISYSKEDMQLMDSMTDDEKKAMKKDIALSYIKHHTSGYDIDNEVIAYAETHQPIIKYEHNKERLEHEHIAIALYNPLNDTKLQTTFHNNSFIDDTLQAYINKKYGLSQPREHQRKRQGIEADTQIARDRKYYKEALKNIKSNSELIQYFKDNNIKYKEVQTKNNQYYKIINTKGTDINLKGKDFEHIHKVTLDEDFVYNEHKDIEELEKVLSSYYEKRIEQIDKRRSISTKEAMQDIYKEQTKDNEYSLQSASYQQKIFYKHYGHLIDNDLKGYFIDTKEADNTKFINKIKNINIEDKGDKIVSYTNDKENLQERVRLMLNVAEAKKWNINNLEINGSKEFKEEAEKQIAERIRLQEQLQKKNDKTLSYTEAVAVKQEIDKRPMTATQTYKKEAEQKQEQIKADNNISLTMLKQNLSAQRVLDYAVEKYKLNPSDYTITEDNKINNLNNKQKPKNVIDFLQKELNIKTNEAIDITRELYKQQPLNIKSNESEREVNAMPMKLSICKDTNPNALSKWEQVEVTNYTQLASYMKQYPYSQAQFEQGYRNSDNAKSFNNVLIYDIDNDKDTPQLTINEAKQLLEKYNISAMILPSKSHNIDKNGHTAERYRIVIPTNKAISTNDKDTYREFQKITARDLQIDKYVDNKALNDKGRFYYKSPMLAEPLIVKANRVMNIDRLEQTAIKNITQKRAEKEAERQRVEAIRKDMSKYLQMPQTGQQVPQTGQHEVLSYVDVQSIIDTPIAPLIVAIEQGQEYKEGIYNMVKTLDAKYSIIDNNIAHDFKSDITYNSLTYLQHKLGISNINNIARELERMLGIEYMQINIEAVKRSIESGIKDATGDKVFEDKLKEFFGVKYAKLEKDSIKIADKEIKLSDVGFKKNQLIEAFGKNREAVKETIEANGVPRNNRKHNRGSIKR